jgi:hypothetical protein
MLARYEAWKAFGYQANRFLMAVRNRGGVGAANFLLAKKGISPGLARLAREGRTDLSVEALVLTSPWDGLFQADNLEGARRALRKVHRNRR